MLSDLPSLPNAGVAVVPKAGVLVAPNAGMLEAPNAGVLEPPNALPDPNTGALDTPNAIPMLQNVGVSVEIKVGDLGVHVALKAEVVIAGPPEISNYNIKSYYSWL